MDPINLDHGDQITIRYHGIELLLTAHPTGNPDNSIHLHRIEVTEINTDESHEFIANLVPRT